MKRGRHSRNDLIIPISSRRSRIEPPPDLTSSEQSLFRNLVANCSPDHFVASDIPILVSYVQSTLMSRRAAKNIGTNHGALNVWDRATRMQATLATRLRLAPQARIDARTIGRKQAAHRPSAYDVLSTDDDA